MRNIAMTQFIKYLVLILIGTSPLPALAAQFGGYLTSQSDTGVSLFGEGVIASDSGRTLVAGFDVGGRSYVMKGADTVTRLVMSPYIGTETLISPTLSLAYRLGLGANLAGDKTDYGFISNKVFFKMGQDQVGQDQQGSERRQISGMMAGWELTINSKQPELNGTEVQPLEVSVFLGTVY